MNTCQWKRAYFVERKRVIQLVEHESSVESMLSWAVIERYVVNSIDGRRKTVVGGEASQSTRTVSFKRLSSTTHRVRGSGRAHDVVVGCGTST